MVADLSGLLDALGIEQAVWFGHDWGSMLRGRGYTMDEFEAAPNALLVPWLTRNFR